MKTNKIIFFIVINLLWFGCHNPNMGGDENDAKIWLIGEEHNVAWIWDLEFTRWKELYNRGYRHLFVEIAYYHGEYLNLRVGSEDNILDTEDTAIQNFGHLLRKIKRECPLTVFHGTDVGHQYESDGEEFLEYLIENNLQDSEQYVLSLEAIEQGKNFYDRNYSEYYRWKYREYTMTQNFIREYDKLKNEQIMGIFGSSHTNYNNQAFFGNYPNMAKQLRFHYGNIIYFENYYDRER